MRTNGPSLIAILVVLVADLAYVLGAEDGPQVIRQRLHPSPWSLLDRGWSMLGNQPVETQAFTGIGPALLGGFEDGHMPEVAVEEVDGGRSPATSGTPRPVEHETGGGEGVIYGSYVDEVLCYQQTVGGIVGRYYPHYNHLYSVAALTDSSGAVVERYTYDAYGRQTIKSAGGVSRSKSAVGWDRGFSGYTEDSESGLAYARTRMYSPTLGRFINRTPWFVSEDIVLSNYALDMMDDDSLSYILEEMQDGDTYGSYLQGRLGLYDFMMQSPGNYLEPYSWALGGRFLTWLFRMPKAAPVRPIPLPPITRPIPRVPPFPPPIPDPFPPTSPHPDPGPGGRGGTSSPPSDPPKEKPCDCDTAPYNLYKKCSEMPAGGTDMTGAYNIIRGAASRRGYNGTPNFKPKGGAASEICPLGEHSNCYGGANGKGDFVGSLTSCKCCEMVGGKPTLKSVWYGKAWDSPARR